MKTISWRDVSGERFPSGRHTRLMVGPDSPVEAERFVMGHVTVEPGGGIPAHKHSQEEVYFIMTGSATLTVNGETSELSAGTAVHLPPGSLHELVNQTHEPVTLIFVYSPKGIVDHWQEEREGRIVMSSLQHGE